MGQVYIFLVFIFVFFSEASVSGIPQVGHLPGMLLLTLLCMVQLYCVCLSFKAIPHTAQLPGLSLILPVCVGQENTLFDTIFLYMGLMVVVSCADKDKKAMDKTAIISILIDFIIFLFTVSYFKIIITIRY